MGLLSRVSAVGAAVSFLRSERGQRVLTEARQHLDTPENRARARRAVSDAQREVRSRLGRRGR